MEKLSPIILYDMLIHFDGKIAVYQLYYKLASPVEINPHSIHFWDALSPPST